MGFRLLNLKGICYREGDGLTLDVDGVKNSINECLEPFLGLETKCFLAHLPSTPPDSSRWGWGSCYWQPSGKCPAGHHESPHSVFAGASTGKVTRKNSVWCVGSLPIPYNILDGHSVHFVVVTDPSALKTGSLSSDELSQVTSLKQILKSFKEKLR